MKIYASISCETDRQLFQQDLRAFCEWSVINRMPLNVAKCRLVSFFKSKNPLVFDYFLDDQVLTRVNVINDLGVIFSSNLTFNSHIDAMVCKAYSMLGFIKRNSKDFHDTLTFKSLYTSYVRSQIEYASIMWSPFYDLHSKRIESVQKQFLLFVLGKLPSAERSDHKLLPYYDRCCLLGLPTLAARRKCASAVFARDILCGKVDCAELLSLFNLYAPQRNLRQREFLLIPTANNNYSHYGPMMRIQRDLNDVSEFFDFHISRDVFKKIISKLRFG